MEPWDPDAADPAAAPLAPPSPAAAEAGAGHTNLVGTAAAAVADDVDAAIGGAEAPVTARRIAPAAGVVVIGKAAAAADDGRAAVPA
jgi:hypothetical protein